MKLLESLVFKEKINKNCFNYLFVSKQIYDYHRKQNITSKFMIYCITIYYIYF